MDYFGNLLQSYFFTFYISASVANKLHLLLQPTGKSGVNPPSPVLLQSDSGI